MDYEFKEVTNLKTGHKTYFINNKRVSFGKYCIESITCDFSGFRYNTSYITTDRTHRRSIYHYIARS